MIGYDTIFAALNACTHLIGAIDAEA